MTSDDLFADYYDQWIEMYKRDAVRDVTLRKYIIAAKWVHDILPTTTLKSFDRMSYQRMLNEYAKTHEKQTTIDFSHLVKSAILDAVDDGLIPRDPTRKAVIKGKPPRQKKIKYLSQYELHALLEALELEGTRPDENWDWLILLVAKTGLRFAEALGLTPTDIDLARQQVSVSKTWDYKGGTGFAPTKNESSKRRVSIDWKTVTQLGGAMEGMNANDPIFVRRNGEGFKAVFNATANDILARRCKQADVPVISMHGLRHTHASLLLYAGASMASVSRRLGHSNMTTTQKVYLHVVKELENQDVDLMMRAMSAI